MKRIGVISRLLLCLLPATFLMAAPQVPRRLHSQIDDLETVQLKGHVRPALAGAQDIGPLSYSEIIPRLSIHFSLTAAQQTDLTQLLRDLQDPNSKNFHKFLTSEEYGSRFGINSADLQKITTWLEEKGFSNVETSRSQTFISFSGSVAQAEAAFHTSLRRYQINGETHFANSSDPEVPKAIGGMVESIRGLHDFKMKSHVQVRPQFLSTTGDHFLAPADFATIYDAQPLYGEGYDGSGVKIAVVGQSDVNLSDIRAFRSKFGLPANDPTTVLAGADPGIQTTGDEGESDLDLEWTGAVAPNASIVCVTASSTSGNGVLDAITYAIDNNVAPILSNSYGMCEADLTTARERLAFRHQPRQQVRRPGKNDKVFHRSSFFRYDN